MRRRLRVSKAPKPTNRRKDLRYSADLQLDWESLVPPLKNFELQSVSFISVPGDAPKDFTTDREYRSGHRSIRERQTSYIAKVGSKFYPLESITEHLITRIGQAFGLNIADSKLRIIEGQVRFMSKYFLRRRSETLTHGAEIYEICLGKDNYAQIAVAKSERDYFSFQMTVEAISSVFPDFGEQIAAGFVEMLAFDALIGHNDRHPYNWGVIVPIRNDKPPRFSPIYDSARALFWNVNENRVRQMLSDKFQLDSYIAKCDPGVCWDGDPDVGFFHLIPLIWEEFKNYRPNVEKVLSSVSLAKSFDILDKEFLHLMSDARRQLIRK